MPAIIGTVIAAQTLLSSSSSTSRRPTSPTSRKLVTTLFQTTGRATSDLGAVNLTAEAVGSNSTVVVRSLAPSPGSSNATVLGAVTEEPYNISVLAVGGLIVPSGPETRPSPAVNITRVLFVFDARGFNVAASMLEASGVADDFEADKRGAGITIRRHRHRLLILLLLGVVAAFSLFRLPPVPLLVSVFTTGFTSPAAGSTTGREPRGGDGRRRLPYGEAWRSSTGTRPVAAA